MTRLIPTPAARPGSLRAVHASDAQLELLWDLGLADLSETSHSTYRARLAKFCEWLGLAPDKLPLLILQSDAASFHACAQRYRKFLATSAMAPATRNLTLAALRRFVERLHAARLIDWTLRIRGFETEASRDTAGPPEPVVRTLLAHVLANVTDVDGQARDEALLRLALSLGLRRSELVGLDIEDVREPSAGRLSVAIRGKGKSGKRPLDVPPAAAAALRRWLVRREHFESQGPVARHPLFIQLTNAARARRKAVRLSDEGFAHFLERLRRAAGIPTRIRAHGLRHRSISSLLESGGTLAQAVAFARHSDPKTTLVYWDSVQQTAEKAAVIVDQCFAAAAPADTAFPACSTTEECRVP